MGPIIGLWRDTWWLWLVLTAAVCLLAFFVIPLYLICLPMLPGIFIYFAFNRYDADGNEKPDVDR